MSNTLLRYDATTDPFPLQASPPAGPAAAARLTVVASNPKADPDRNPVTVQGLSITIHVGPDAADLTADASGVQPVAPPGWKLHETKKSDNTVEYVFLPEAGQGAVGGQGLVFVFNNIAVNAQPGPTTVTVKEGSAGNPIKALPVTKFPAGWGQVSFRLDPADVPFGGATTLHWSGPAAGPTGATYTIQYAQEGRVVNVPAQGEPPLGAQGRYPADGAPPLALERTTVFTLNVKEDISGVSYQAQLQKTASMSVPPPSISLDASPSLLNASGETPVTLSWKAENASEVNIGGNFSSKELKGSWVVTTHEPQSYLAKAYGLAGYSGPPAFAQAAVGGLVSSGFQDVWKRFRASDQTSLELWSFGLGPARPIFKLNWRLVSPNQPGPNEDVEVTIAPAAKVLVAYFGKARGGVSSSELMKASYSPSMSPDLLWTGHYEGSDVYRSPSHSTGTGHGAGNTWGFKSESGALALVWFEAARPENQYYSDTFWSFDFGLLDVSRPGSLASTQTDSEAEEGEAR